jgi:hypothetical protein
LIAVLQLTSQIQVKGSDPKETGTVKSEMADGETGAGQNPLGRFLAEPLSGKYPAPMRNLGDWFSVSGILLFVVAVFALPWLTVGLKDIFGLSRALGVKPSKSYGLFVSPWAWIMVVVLVAMIAGLWFVQTRGGILLGAGILCLIFNVFFFIGVWKKINGVIGDVVSLARSIPFIGELLGTAVSQIVKSMLEVHVAIGYWLFIPAGVLLILGGSIRLASGRGAGEALVE